MLHSTAAAAWLFAYDWDQVALQRLQAAGVARFDRAGFDLFTAPSNLALAWFDLEAFVARQAVRGRKRGWRAVLSHHEQFGALAAALLAERLGLPGASPQSILAAQHKLYARRVLSEVAPEASLPFQAVEASLADALAGALPHDLALPAYVKPVKAAFSVLARRVDSRAELARHLRFSPYERWLLQRLAQPFEQVRRTRLPDAGSAQRVFLEAPVAPATPQFNLDGWAFNGQVHALGVVDAVMVPGTQAFLRWEVPSRLPADVQTRALDVARRFLGAIGYDHGFFNFEFFYDAASDKLTVIECNPRLASQFGDLYARVRGVDAHAMSVALAFGDDPQRVARSRPAARVAASLVYRAFPGDAVPAAPRRSQREALQRLHPEALLIAFPKRGAALARDLRWTGSHRYGVLHLGAHSWDALRAEAQRASGLLGWPAPYPDGSEIRGVDPAIDRTIGPAAHHACPHAAHPAGAHLSAHAADASDHVAASRAVVRYPRTVQAS